MAGGNDQRDWTDDRAAETHHRADQGCAWESGEGGENRKARLEKSQAAIDESIERLTGRS